MKFKPHWKGLQRFLEGGIVVTLAWLVYFLITGLPLEMTEPPFAASVLVAWAIGLAIAVYKELA